MRARLLHFLFNRGSREGRRRRFSRSLIPRASDTESHGFIHEDVNMLRTKRAPGGESIKVTGKGGDVATCTAVASRLTRSSDHR